MSVSKKNFCTLSVLIVAVCWKDSSCPRFRSITMRSDSGSALVNRTLHSSRPASSASRSSRICANSGVPGSAAPRVVVAVMVTSSAVSLKVRFRMRLTAGSHEKRSSKARRKARFTFPPESQRSDRDALRFAPDTTWPESRGPRRRGSRRSHPTDRCGTAGRR